MRLNKRLIMKAPKRGPEELEIELSKLEKIRSDPVYRWRSTLNAFKIFANNLKNMILQIGNALYSIIKPVVDVINNHEKYKNEDSELFKTLPSIRRFEHNMT